MAQAERGIHKRQFQLKRPHDVILSGHRWEPVPSRNGNRFLVFTHGACEYVERYPRLMRTIAEAGWTAIAADLRGHGNSTGDCVHVNHFHEYCDDLLAILEHQEAIPTRTVLLATSMGGLITLRTLQRYWQVHQSQPCRAAVLLSPLLGIRHPIEDWKKMVAHAVGTWLPRTRFRSTIDPSILTHDLELVKDKKADQKIRNAVTARWYLEANNAMQAAFRDSADYRVPTLLLQSGADYVVDPLTTRAWVDQVNSAAKTDSPLIQFHQLNGWYHEVLNEPQGDIALRALLQFANDQLDREINAPAQAAI